MRSAAVVLTFSVLAPLLPGVRDLALPGETTVTRWQDGKEAAISLTYDDNTINQFRVALPLMDKYGFKGTFYVITGSVPGSQFQPRFVGRPLKEIIAETARVPTNEANFFERASAIRFAPYEDAYRYHVRAGELYGSGRLQRAYAAIDEGFARIRSGASKPSTAPVEIKKLLDSVLYIGPDVGLITWKELQRYAGEGHEIGSHSVSHTYLSVLDSANMAYELTRSKEELLNRLGPAAAFSAEIPFGLEDPRVMRMGHELYPALRNRMPRPYLTEIDRGSKADPLQSDKEYVQWQRGPLTNTSMELMESWVDTSLKTDNIWLVLVFHGIDGIGWEPLTHRELDEYFSYIRSRRDRIWVATFEDVTKYLRERMSANVQASDSAGVVDVELTHALNPVVYDLPLTLRTYVPGSWNSVRVKQGSAVKTVSPRHDRRGAFVLYRAEPNGVTIRLTRG